MDSVEDLLARKTMDPALESDQKLRQPTGNAEKVADGESQIDPENSPEVESSSSTSPLAFVKVFVLFTVWQVTAVVNGMCCNQTDLQTAVNDWYANTTFLSGA